MAYLDYNATAPLRPAVMEAMTAVLGATGNASSVHRSGRRARRAIEAARRQVAALVRADPERVVFTSGGTEANNLALSALPGRALVSAVEHPSVLRAAGDGAAIPVDAHGVVDLEALARLLADVDGPVVVSVMAANNETGVLQPIAEAARIAHEAGAFFHCDAVQAAGRIDLDIDGLGADAMTLSAHKLGGPQGVGCLVFRGDRIPAPMLKGGTQEKGWRAGTENLPGIVGFGVAAEEAVADLGRTPALAAMRDRLEREALAAVPGAAVLGADAPRVATTSCLAMPGVASETQVIALDLAGVEVSAGAACSSGKVHRSHVLDAMGVPEPIAESAIRVSLGWASEAADIDAFLAAWAATYARAGGGAKMNREEAATA
ncbi:MAG: cysteine desulfurase [Rhodospirillaceae bacterium]|nr:cysteine desulfurase [Rhodospirillaceae bacterium]